MMTIIDSRREGQIRVAEGAKSVNKEQHYKRKDNKIKIPRKEKRSDAVNQQGRSVATTHSKQDTALFRKYRERRKKNCLVFIHETT